MTDAVTPPPAAPAAWTCPFCPLLCDGFTVDTVGKGEGMRLVGSNCPRARAALSRFGAEPSMATPRIDGEPATLAGAIAEAARRLGASRQPLIGGLGTDVAGARALYALACETGAIADSVHGPGLMAGVRALQDRGGYTTTLAEVRTRADLIVCVGGLPSDRYPEFFNRCGVGPGSLADPQIVILHGCQASARAALVALAGPRAECVSVGGDLFEVVAQLAAAVASPSIAAALPPAIVSLAERLHAASYAVLVYDTAALPDHGALVIETVQRIVESLNRRTRAASLALGGSDGSSTVNQVFAWLSGLPLRTRPGPTGLEHEPFCHDARRLLADRAVDALVWVAAFGSEPPPPTDGPATRIVIGHPRFVEGPDAAAPGIYIPVATPGIGAAGHLFRTDGTVVMPLSPVRAESLPGVAEVATRLTQALREARATQGALQ